MEIEAVLEANKNLSKRIKKLEAEKKHLEFYKLEFDRARVTIDALREDLFRKHNTVRIISEKGGVNYLLQIKSIQDMAEGLFIEVHDSVVPYAEEH